MVCLPPFLAGAVDFSYGLGIDSKVFPWNPLKSARIHEKPDFIFTVQVNLENLNKRIGLIGASFANVAINALSFVFLFCRVTLLFLLLFQIDLLRF